MAAVLSLNIGQRRPIAAKSGWTGIDKLPSTGAVAVRAPGPRGTGAGGIVGDAICDTENHGGDDQALYAYAREDLDGWQRELGQPLRSGSFGENLTTLGVDASGALIGEQWRIGQDVLLQVTSPRIPCVTFAAWMRDRGWLKKFTQRAVPGAYLRVLTSGTIQAGDPISIEFRPPHRVTIGVTFRALTLEPELLPTLLDASDYLGDDILHRARNRQPFDLFPVASSA
ncbi:MAG TPA: MOSC domain-containing protein [Chloroflexota bacterium]|nr:MOSC domain-containing protein [Chloroflexota bacterium]